MSSEARVDFNGSVEVHDGTRAIEVAALFEDSVVGVCHLTDPKAGITRATRILLGSGGVSFLAAFALFLVAYSSEVGRALDVATFALLAYAGYAVVHGMLRLLEERRPRDFTIGADRLAYFAAPGEGLPLGAFPLVRSTGSDYELCFTPALTGDVSIEGDLSGQRRTFAELVAAGLARPSAEVAGAYAYAIPERARIQVTFGQNTFVISSVAPPRRQPAPIEIDWSKHVYTAAMALVAGAFLLLINAIPPDPHSLVIDDLLHNSRIAVWLNKPVQEETKLPEWLQKTELGKPGGGGKAAAGEAGKMGRQNGPKVARSYGIKGDPKNVDLALAKRLAYDRAIHSGVLGSMADGSHIASIFGRDRAIGRDAMDALGHLSGDPVGEADGDGGQDLVGTGKGGGGTGPGTIGVGPLGTIGKSGNYPGGDYGKYVHQIDARTKKEARIEAIHNETKVFGGIDKEIVKRVIHAHMHEVKFCYEQELMKKPELWGRVMANFTIANTGKVISSGIGATTMNNPAVEQCIAQAVRRWEFPRPDGGGIVVVSYPFMLRSAGAN